MARVIIAGAGVLGCAIAWRLAEAGNNVTLVDPEPGGLASPGSFAWLNASFAEDPVYNRLRHDSLEIWRQLKDQDPSVPVAFPGAILWEQDHFDLPAIEASQHALGRPAVMLRPSEVAAQEPAVAKPGTALFLKGDGYGDPALITAWFLDNARAAGAELLSGQTLDGIETTEGQVSGARLSGGWRDADHIILAAGVRLHEILSPQGLAMAMDNEPGLLARTTASEAQITAMLATPDVHIWQGADGCFLIGADFGGSQDAPDQNVEADRNLTALHQVLPGAAETRIASVTVRERPKPADGRPAIGPLGPDGLYIVSTHSGMTLAPVIGEMVAAEISGLPDPRLTPYRPGRASLQPES